nr:hypothetical protein [Skermanella rosea]
MFGPVVCVYAYDDLDGAIGRANALPYARLGGSAVMVNDHTAFRVDGCRSPACASPGLGVGGTPYTFRDMRVEKLFVGRMG